MNYQKTIAQSIQIKGQGLHTGNLCTLNLHPAQPNSGFILRNGNVEQKISVKSVVDTTRSTNIKIGNDIVYTIEHLFSAIAALQIDNLIIEVDGNEIPILDGSAKLFLDKILNSGIKEEKVERHYFVVDKVIEWIDTSTHSEYTLIPFDGFDVTCLIDYNSKTLGKQYAALERWEDYSEEVAPAKTFCFLHEIEYLYRNGLIKGGNLMNALVYSEDKIEPEKAQWLAKTFNQPIFSIPEKGLLNPLYQTFDNEAARHKLLDLIGDLALLDKPIKGKLIATKPGHTSNVRFVNYLCDNYL